MTNETQAAARRTTWRHWLLLVAIVGTFVAAAGSAMRHTSTTFDEILLPSAGARGYMTGSFKMITLYHPPVLQYVYGLPVALADFTYPAEMDVEWNDRLSFSYARSFYFGLGNDPARLAFLARTMGIVIGVLLILVTFLFTRTAAGPGTAVLAAALVAFLPDVLAHSGISYNDVPIALVVLLALWAADAAIRDPRPWRAALCGAALGLALGVKFSAVALGPAGVLLLIIEAVRRWPDPLWVRRILLHAAPLVLVALYVTLVIIYLGDFALVDLRAGLLFNISHASLGHGAAAVLMGRYSVTGWWYFFPLAFFLKTSAGLHLLIITGLAAMLAARPEFGWRGLAASRLRVPAVGAVVFLGFVMAAKLNIGFRHALPILPLVCILTAVAVSRAWTMRRPVLRFAIALGAAWHILSSLSVYPWFLSYLSEYTGPVEDSHQVLVDSSRDWGQGLIALREFMREEGIDSVLLSYFGSASPASYGVTYVPLPSFFPLQPQPTPPGAIPPWLAISATNLAGNYLNGDPFARFREVQPYRIVGGSIFVFRLEEE
jgi:hypothetical protein